MEPYADPSHPGNSPEHHTGKPCIERDCNRPAGTDWSPYWCFEHNVERMQRIDAGFDAIKARFAEKGRGGLAMSGPRAEAGAPRSRLVPEPGQALTRRAEAT